MNSLPQPKLHQIQYYVKKMRQDSGVTEASNCLESILTLMNMKTFEKATKNETAFFFG